MMRLTLLVAALAISAPVHTTNAQPTEHPTPTRTVSGESAGTVSPVAAAEKGKGMPTEITLHRETFAYNGGGRRDPYKSLMSSSEVRPLLSDLRLTAVAFDPVGAGSNSVAILRDTYSKQQYRIRVGQQLGRLRVAAIRQRAVQFTIEEFGFNRQETLPLSSDTTKARNP